MGYLLLRCFSCKGFSNQQSTKASRWECKRCGAKQSVQRIFFSSESASDVREALTRVAVQVAAADAASAASALALERDAEEARARDEEERETAAAETAARSRLEAIQARAAAHRVTASVGAQRDAGHAGVNDRAGVQGGLGFEKDIWADFL
jgi:hypothetical protein